MEIHMPRRQFLPKNARSSGAHLAWHTTFCSELGGEAVATPGDARYAGALRE